MWEYVACCAHLIFWGIARLCVYVCRCVCIYVLNNLSYDVYYIYFINIIILIIIIMIIIIILKHYKPSLPKKKKDDRKHCAISVRNLSVIKSCHVSNALSVMPYLPVSFFTGVLRLLIYSYTCLMSELARFYGREGSQS